MSVIHGRILGRILYSEGDYLGRWTRTLFAGKKGKKVVVYNMYQVGKKNPNDLGESTIARQLQAVYQKENRETDNPRINHTEDLRKALLEDFKCGHQMIIGGDFNQDLSKPSVMDEILRRFNLVDPIQWFHDIKDETTYNRGSTVIDYVLVSREILGAVEKCSYHAFNEYLLGDHRAIYIDFNTKVLFGHP